MKLEDAKMQFVQAWGSFGSSWGVPRSLAQIHALLLATERGLSTEEVMEQTRLSRGNVNINLRELVNWKLAQKQHKLGERKDFFIADHDIWRITKSIVQERKKRELEPIQSLLNALRNEQLEGDPEEVAHFAHMVKELDDFLTQMDKLTGLMEKLNGNIFFRKMAQMMT